MSGPVEAAEAAWGEELPDWVVALARACAETSQAAVARRIGRSGSLVSQVLRKLYPGDLVAVEELVRGALLAETVPCPALGPLAKDQCAGWRRAARDFAGHNMLRVQMYRACRRCPRFTGREEGADG